MKKQHLELSIEGKPKEGAVSIVGYSGKGWPDLSWISMPEAKSNTTILSVPEYEPCRVGYLSIGLSLVAIIIALIALFGSRD